MKALQLHTDYVEYEPIAKESSIAEEVEIRTYRVKDVVLLLLAIEEGDDEELARKMVNDVAESMKNLNSNRLLLYPYAHLSSNLAKPSEALRLIKRVEKYAKEAGLEVIRSPFGWNKRLTIAIKGHPLAEQFKSLEPGQLKKDEKVSKALVAEERLKSSWYIITPEGDMIPVDEFNFSGYENLKAFADYEIAKSRVARQMPPHVTLMRKLEIADYEEGSDLGNFRWPAKGRLVKSLLEHYVTQKVIEYGAIEIETPVMYDFHHPSLESYLHRFPARQYIVRSEDKEYFLRFAACFGQFLMAKDMQLSYKHLPIRLYELTRYSFRREKSGELAGLRRLRAFTMPDVHAFCKDIEQAKEEMKKRFKLSLSVLKDIGLGKDDFEFGIRFTKDFFNRNREFILELVREFGKPALAEVWEQRFFYFILKWEFNFVDNLGKAAALSTDQIDVENAERYGIQYVDEDGSKKNPVILHCSPSGAIERTIYALLEKAYKMLKKGEKPSLPLWLSPTQVRIIPVSNDFMEDCVRLMKEIRSSNIRVDLDDRDETVDKKVRDAETEWIRYIIVYGKREKESGVLSVRDRMSGELRRMDLKELIEEIVEQVKGKPFKELSLPSLLSRRPSFK